MEYVGQCWQDEYGFQRAPGPRATLSFKLLCVHQLTASTTTHDVDLGKL